MSSLLACAPVFGRYSDAERLESYRKGGFHPTHIGDLLHNRYRIINKLGYGSYGTVWLVEEPLSGRFAALKILSADVSMNISEVTILRHLERHDDLEFTHDGRKYVIKFFDDFRIEGPNGTHQCIVTEVLGPNMTVDIEDIYTNEQLPIGVAKSLVAKILRGVASLHSKLGFIHGDLHPGNVLLGIEKMSRADLEHYIGVPLKRPLVYEDDSPVVPTPHQPNYLARSLIKPELLELCLLSTPPSSIDPKICDFGESLFWDLTHKAPLEAKLNIPCVYAAPEIISQDRITPAVDVWALAVITHMIMSGGTLLFHSWSGARKDVLKKIVSILGKLPDRYWDLWDKEERGEYFDEDGKWVGGDEEKALFGHGQLMKMPSRRMGEDDLRLLEEVLRKMVHYEPKDRITIDEAVRLVPESWMYPEPEA